MAHRSIAASPDPALNTVQVRVSAGRFDTSMRTNSLRRSLLLAVLFAATAGVTACGSSSKPASAPASTSGSSPGSTVAPVIDPGDGGNYHPRIAPADFV